MGPGFESLRADQTAEGISKTRRHPILLTPSTYIRPVGQVVKTEASHAFNIGSNPVRVTSKTAAGRLLFCNDIRFLRNG